MKVYKLFKLKNGKLYPLYIYDKEEIEIGKWLKAKCGPLADETHVYCRKFQKLALRPGYHSTTVPFSDWIGKKQSDGTLARRPDNVWAECEIRGKELIVTENNGLRTIPKGYYRFKTNTKQKEPWLISGEIKVNRVLSNEEVDQICISKGFVPQKIAM